MLLRARPFGPTGWVFLSARKRQEWSTYRQTDTLTYRRIDIPMYRHIDYRHILLINGYKIYFARKTIWSLWLGCPCCRDHQNGPHSERPTCRNIYMTYRPTDTRKTQARQNDWQTNKYIETDKPIYRHINAYKIKLPRSKPVAFLGWLSRLWGNPTNRQIGCREHCDTNADTSSSNKGAQKAHTFLFQDSAALLCTS